MNICSAEIMAIHKACLDCLERDVDNAIIFIDSKSALDKLAETDINHKRRSHFAIHQASDS